MPEHLDVCLVTKLFNLRVSKLLRTPLLHALDVIQIVESDLNLQMHFDAIFAKGMVAL